MTTLYRACTGCGGRCRPSLSTLAHPLCKLCRQAITAAAKRKQRSTEPPLPTKWAAPIPMLPTDAVRPDDAPRVRVLADGTVCEVVWAGDMTRHGEKGGLLEPRATRSLDIRDHAPGQIDIYQHVRSDQTAYHRAKNKARLKARRQRQRDAQPVVRKRAVAA